MPDYYLKTTGMEGYGTNELKRIVKTKTGEYSEGGIPQATKDKAWRELQIRDAKKAAKPKPGYRH